MKKLCLLLAVITALTFSACGTTPQTQEQKSEYKPLIKEDLMWNTDEIFNRTVKVTEGDKGNYVNAYGTTKAIFMDGPKYLGKDTTCFAYIGHPSSEMPEGGYPGIVLVHGGGGCAFYEWVEYWNGKGYVAIAIDTYGQQYGNKSYDGKGAPKNPNGGPTDSGSFKNTAQDFTDSWVYHSVYNIMSAHNVLLCDETVNPEKTAITGISWGSVLTEITAGVDYRFKAFAPVYGSGFLLETPGALKSSYFSYPHNATEWMNLYDPSTYLQYCNRPIMFTIGTNDSYFNPLLVQQCASLCQGEVYTSFRQELKHYHRWKDEEDMIHVYKFIDGVLNGSNRPFNIIKESVKIRTINLEFDDVSNIKEIKKMYLTNTAGSSLNWSWDFEYIKPTEIEGKKLSVTVPTGAELCFIEINDGEFEGYYMSSQIYQF